MRYLMLFFTILGMLSSSSASAEWTGHCGIIYRDGRPGFRLDAPENATPPGSTLAYKKAINGVMYTLMLAINPYGAEPKSRFIVAVDLWTPDGNTRLGGIDLSGAARSEVHDLRLFVDQNTEINCMSMR